MSMSTFPRPRSPFRHLVLLPLVFALGSCAADKQAADPRPAATGDPQAAYEPRSAAGRGQEFLARLAGEWAVTKTFFPRSGEPAVTQGECRQSMIHDGRFLQSEFVFGRGEGRTTGLGIIGFSAETGRFTSFWTDSRSTRMSIRESEQPFDGQQVELHSRALDGREQRRSRTVTRLEDDGSKLVHSQYSMQQDGKERLVMQLVMTRKPAGAASR
jgi:Protein of unknown function (DUF1579)